MRTRCWAGLRSSSQGGQASDDTRFSPTHKASNCADSRAGRGEHQAASLLLAPATLGPDHGRGGGGGRQGEAAVGGPAPPKHTQRECVMRSCSHHSTSKPGRETEQAERVRWAAWGPQVPGGLPRRAPRQLLDGPLLPSGPQFPHGKNGILSLVLPICLIGAGCILLTERPHNWWSTPNTSVGFGLSWEAGAWPPQS